MPLPPAHLYFPLALLLVGALFTMLGEGVKLDIFNWSAAPPIQRAARLAAAFGLILMAGGTILAIRGESAEPSKPSESLFSHTAPGPWDVAGVIVNEGGRTKILDRKRRIVGALPAALGMDLVGFGTAPAHR
jgi:hypothetical protein